MSEIRLKRPRGRPKKISKEHEIPKIKRPRGRPRKLHKEIESPKIKRPRGRPRKLPEKLPKEPPKGFETCPVCKGKKRHISKKWGTKDPCIACDETGLIRSIK